jgi:hypothetical protein
VEASLFVSWVENGGWCLGCWWYSLEWAMNVLKSLSELKALNEMIFRIQLLQRHVKQKQC